jgi:hypothetical protein
MSRSRAKGTRWESELLTRLRNLWGQQVERAPLKGTNDRGDFVGTPFLVEAKSTTKPLFQAWARVCESKAYNWAIVWHGDRRERTGVGPYVVMPLHLFEDLVARVDGDRARELVDL